MLFTDKGGQLRLENICRPIFLPLLFTLTHPLDEISPILVKDTAALDAKPLGVDKSTAAALGKENCDDAGFIPYARDPALRPVQVCETGQTGSQLLMTCDPISGCHRLWSLRRASAADWEPCLQQQQHVLPKQQHVSTAASLLSGSYDRLGSPWSTPLTCYGADSESARRSTPYPHMQRTLTPGLGRSMAGLEAQPTGQLIRPRHCMQTLWTEPPGSAHLSATAPASSSTPVSLGGGATMHSTPVCMEVATKAFVVQDMAGARYLCYLIPTSQQLRCLPLLKDLTPGE